MATPVICETIGDGHTVGYGNGNQQFQTIHRAKDPKHRVQIALIARESCGKGIKYSQPGHADYFNFLAKYKNVTSRLKAIKTKAKYHTCDCSGFASACALGGGASFGIRDSRQIANGTFSKFKHLSFKNQINAGTWQRGDIVAKNGHAAVIVDDGPNCTYNFDKHFYKDGSKKITSKTLKKIRDDYVIHYKRQEKKHEGSAKELQAYINKMKKARETLLTKINNQKKKEKTIRRDEYIKKLKKTRKQLLTAINYAKDRLKKIKNKKNTKDGAKKSKKKSKTTQTTTTTNESDYDDEYDDEYDYEYDDEDLTKEDTEPVILPEQVDYYFIRSGPSYYAPTNVQGVDYKDYIGKVFCKRKVKIPTLVAENNEWTFNFDLNFQSASFDEAEIKSITKVSGNDNIWKVITKVDNTTGRVPAGQYKFTMTTSAGIVYNFMCQIESFEEGVSN